MPEFRNKVAFDDVRCIKETASAILVVIPDHGEVWFPQSQIDDDSEVYGKDHEGKLVVSQWIAEQRELAF